MTTRICCNCRHAITGVAKESGGVFWHPYSCVSADSSAPSTDSSSDLLNPLNPISPLYETFSAPDYSTPDITPPDTSSFDFGGGGDFSGGGGGSDF